MSDVVANILHVPAWLALLIVFALPALEASIFLGFVFPGETAVLLGGVLAFETHLSLGWVVLAAVSGAVIGDNVGYAVGFRFGDALLRRIPPRVLKPEHVERSKELIRRLGGRAVFVGRFTAALRALVPGFCGASRMHYRTFLVWNFLGGALWATGVAVAGYLAGNAWHRVASGLSVFGYVVLGLVLAALGYLWWRHRRRARQVGEE
jgi:membrane-associated protein